eukprot:2796538-Alexandrium_andersonii.AAC.1
MLRLATEFQQEGILIELVAVASDLVEHALHDDHGDESALWPADVASAAEEARAASSLRRRRGEEARNAPCALCPHRALHNACPTSYPHCGTAVVTAAA